MEFELRCTSWMNDKEVLARVRKAAMERLMACGALVEAEAKQLLSKGKRTKQRDQKGRMIGGKAVKTPHVASDAGQPPHIDTGNLRASIQHAKTPENTVVVGPTTVAWYGRVHEFGCVYESKGGVAVHMPERPFMRPALRNCQDRFADKFKDLPMGGDINQ